MSTIHYVKGNSGVSLAQSRLVIPSISIGNIPQLSIDLLVHTLDSVKVAVLDDTYLHPFSSPIDSSQSSGQAPAAGGIANALEVYYSPTHHLTYIQQRSPIISNFTVKFIKEVIFKFITEIGFSKVIILDSSDAGLLENITPDTSIEIFTNEDLLNKSLESLKISNVSNEPQSLASNDPYKYSKFVLELIKELNTTKVDIDVYVSHVYEGDNFNDAELLASALSSRLLNDTQDVQKWTRPVSWLGAYGDKPVPNAMEEGLFG